MTDSRHRARNRQARRRADSARDEALAWRGDDGAGGPRDPDRQPDSTAEPDQTHTWRQVITLECPGCGRTLGRVAVEDVYLVIRARYDQQAARRDPRAERNGAGQHVISHRDPYALLELSEVGRTLAWRCANRDRNAHTSRPMGQVPMRGVLALAETIRATPGPEALRVRATGRAITIATMDRLPADPTERTEAMARVAAGARQWARSWEYDGPATWARQGYTVADDAQAHGNTEKAERARAALDWADQCIGKFDKPTWWHNRGVAVNGARLRADLAAHFWPAPTHGPDADAIARLLAAIPRTDGEAGTGQ